MAFTLRIGGVDRTSLYNGGSLMIEKALKARGTMDFELNDRAGSYCPVDGETVEFFHGDALIFGGRVYQPVQRKMGEMGGRRHSVGVNDWHEVCGRILVAEVYEDKTAGYIVSDIRARYLDAEGITEGDIQAGPVLSKVIFDYQYASECFDRLSELTGFEWEIEPGRALNFFARSSYAAPFHITGATAVRNVQVSTDRSQYRNRQYVRGVGITDTLVREFTGDGKTTTFSVDYGIAEEPVVKVNGVPKAVGIRGVDTGKDWYWNKDDRSITQDSGGVVLALSDTLRIEFKGYYRTIVVSESPASIAERRSVEGGTGVYEAIEARKDVDTAAAALDSANALLRRFAYIPEVITYETSLAGLEPGMIQNVNLSLYGVNAEFLITKVTITDQKRADRALTYTVTGVSGEALGGWVNAFRALEAAAQAQALDLAMNEALIRLVRVAEGWGWTESHAVTVNSCPVPSSSLYPSPSLFPC